MERRHRRGSRTGHGVEVRYEEPRHATSRRSSYQSGLSFPRGKPSHAAASVLMMLAAGFGQETVARGYLFERLGKLLGHRVGAKLAIVLLSSGLFAGAHYFDQGVPGVEQAAITGLLFDTIFAITERIFPLM